MSRCVGICLGAMNITVAEETGDGVRFSRFPHEGNVSASLRTIIEEYHGARIGITGRKFRRLVNAPTLPESEAVELAFDSVRGRYPDIDCIVSAGGESFIAYNLDSQGHISSVHTGNKCASGTGEFFLQQVRRMGLSPEQAVTSARHAEPYSVASRCTVFCKSDCTHALNKGVPRERVTAGLCRMMAGKIALLLRTAGANKALVVGGVSQNAIVMEHLALMFPNITVPPEGAFFEALGAMEWAAGNGSGVPAGKGLIRTGVHSFSGLPTIGHGLEKVTFHPSRRGTFTDPEYILGLDVGSTTTKAVLMGTGEKTIISSVYLRTDGDPVGAARSCYRGLLEQLPEGFAPRIVGLGVTGSGRKIAGLHALTDTVINEIIAHAAAAVHFDPEVDTIFEIGGQDAKYTHLTNGVPVDYAMNEACSAGTGSFLEEACRESFGLETEAIGDVALEGTDPPDFNDQCSAFISSDIKTAMQEGLAREDIAAGLVYSVCRNYLSRVRGNRRTGRKIFMQGGVCYNRAVPPAMAQLCGTAIVVPPDPGLMGAFGAALEALRKIEEGTADRKIFSLEGLASRKLEPCRPFVCDGGREKCDRKCLIARYRVDGRVYPFGGACDRHYNLEPGREDAPTSVDMVRMREETVFGLTDPPGKKGTGKRQTIGILSSLFSNTFFSLYRDFFEGLGLETVRSLSIRPDGMEAVGAAFCLPLLHSHGHLHDLLERGVDRIFIPHVKRFPSGDKDAGNCTCPLVQGEPYILRAAFNKPLSDKLLTAIIDFSRPGQAREAFIRLGIDLGFPKGLAARSFQRAFEAWRQGREELSRRAAAFLAEMGSDDSAIILFGRPYNAFTSLANMGIPAKFTSRGYPVIPHDILSAAGRKCRGQQRMYYATGREILAAAEFVRDQAGLFGVFVTSFSCGPDSFIIERFRSIMGDKPYLILELDAHTADAGIDTRIEAFLDVAQSFRRINPVRKDPEAFEPCRIVMENGNALVRTPAGKKIPVTDPEIHLLVPSMGDISSPYFAAALRFAGIRATSVPRPGRDELLLGSECASCKECLPYLLTSGSLRRYMRDRADNHEILLYLVPEANGPCRFGLYGEAIRSLIQKEGMQNTAVFSLSSSNGYQGFPDSLLRRGFLAIAIADGLTDIRAAILTLAREQNVALRTFKEVEDSICLSIASDPEKQLEKILRDGMARLAGLERSGTVQETTKVLLTGEIYVRKDSFSNYEMVRRLAEEGILVRTSPTLEWISYIDHIVITGILGQATLRERMALWLRNRIGARIVGKVQKTLETSGFYSRQDCDMPFLVDRGSRLIHSSLTGEAILTVGATMSEIGDMVHGVISISPFGCMPGRLAEAIITHRLKEDKPLFSRDNSRFWETSRSALPLPFLALETDGSALSQMAEAKLESFIRSAHRLKEEMRKRKEGDVERLTLNVKRA